MLIFIIKLNDFGVSRGLVLANISLKNRWFLKLLALAGTYFLRPKNRNLIQYLI